jgi:hypothetical protein
VILLVVVAAARVVCRLIPRVGAAASRARIMCGDFMKSRELHDPALLLQLTAGLGALAFVALALYHWPEATVFATYIDTAPPDRLAALANEPNYDVLQRQFEYVLLAYGFVAYLVYSNARGTGARIPPAMLAYAIAVPVIAIVLLRVLPWRIMYDNKLPRMDHGATRCYAIGQHADQTLGFCPDDDPPRVRTYRTGELQDRDFDEIIFTPRDQARVFAAASPQR